MIDEELLRPSREHLAALLSKIEKMERETIQKVERFGYVDDDRLKQIWREFHMAIEPMRREAETVVKVIADYHALQAAPLPLVIPKD